MTSLLTSAADALFKLNPRLCKDPPRADPDEYCYMGPDGGTEGAVLCKEIPYSMATCVGSWLLSPTHHIVEGIAVTVVSLLILARTMPKIYKMTDIPTLNVHHPVWARGASFFCFGMVMCYKYFGYPSRVFYVVMPCNMQWALSFVQCFLIPTSWQMAQYILLQMRLTFLMSVVIAIVTPETEDCTLPFEYIFYWFNHALLLLLPAAYVANGCVSCYFNSKTVSTWSLNRLWWEFSCALMAVFYFIPVTLMAIYSGLNLNFMLHPPHDHFALKGQWFRVTAVLLLALLFGVSRLLVMGLEKSVLGRSVTGSNENSTDSPNEAKKTSKSKQN